MNGWIELLAMNLLRTTSVTCVAAVVAIAFLAALRIRSSKLHRITWVLVLLQGWLVPTYIWRIELDRPQETAIVCTSAEVSLTSAPAGPMAAELPVVESTQRLDFITFVWRVALLVWSLGGFALLAMGLTQYFRLFVSERPGDTPDDPEWLAEWKQVCSSSSLRERVELRITRSLGPLVCWVPRLFLILVPRTLWSRLTTHDRIAILRHELAHCERGDLWKSLAVRMLALPQWFNPLARLAVRRFEEAGEWACDEACAASEARTEYASTLVRVADFATQIPCGAAGVTGGELTRRVKRLLHLPNKEVREMRGIILPILLVVIGLLQSVRIERVEAKEPRSEALASRTAAETTKPPKSKWNFDQPYIIEPPDILLINAGKIVPKETHKIERYDRLTVRVEAADNRPAPIANTYVVDTKGDIDLGPNFGRINVSDITIDDAQKALRAHVARKHPGFKVSVSLAYAAGGQQIVGEHLVGINGRVNLGSYGSVYLAGLTLDEAKSHIETKLSEFLVNPEVTVEVFANNSKKYYLITKSPNGDRIVPMPITGNETVLDAIAQVGGIGERSANVWIARPAPNGRGSEQILRVDMLEITNGDDLSTNHQLWPGDRVCIEYPEQAAAIPFAVEEVEEHSTPAPQRQVDTGTALEIQRWGVQLVDDTAVLQVSTNTESKFVMATITSLQKAGIDTFTLRVLDPNDETEIANSAFSINITDDVAEITTTADMPDKFIQSLISQLKDAGITRIKSAVLKDSAGRQRHSDELAN